MEINLLKYNRHWDKGFFYPYPKKRRLFSALKDYMSKRQIIELSGLRRVGKSTLIFQLINHIKHKKIDPFSIFYFTFDEYQPSLDNLLSEFAVKTGKDYKKEKIYVFLDEIQKLSNFQNQLKAWYDLYPNIKFVTSGSTSLFIRKKSQESLAGRIFSFRLGPLSFPEYLFFKEKEDILAKPSLYRAEIKKELRIFLKSQFIESIALHNSEDRRLYFISIIRKIIYEDLPVVFKFDNPDLLYKIVQFIAQKPGCIINNLHLAQDLGISNKTVAQYLSYLEDSFLLKRFYNFSRNIISSDKRLKKYYLSSPSFSDALVDFSDEARLFENYVASLTKASYFYRDAYKNEVDFVEVDKGRFFKPIEVKYKDRLDQYDVRNIFFFLNKFGAERGTVIYGGVEKRTLKEGKKRLECLPFYSFTGNSR